MNDRNARNASSNAAVPISEDLAALRSGVVLARLRRRGRNGGGPRRLLPAAPRPRTRSIPAPRTHRTAAGAVVVTATGRDQEAARSISTRSISRTSSRTSSRSVSRTSSTAKQGRAGTIRDVAATLWTREEETRLVQELRDGLTVDDIATAHQRSPMAILARASRMTPDELPDGLAGDDVQAQTRSLAGSRTGALTRAQRTEWLREQLHTNPAYDWAAHLGQTRRRRYAEVRSHAPRTGAIWTAEEDTQVLAATAAGVPTTELAAQLQRSPKSTARRAWRLTQSQTSAQDRSASGDGEVEGIGDDVGGIGDDVGDVVDSRTTPATESAAHELNPSALLQTPASNASATATVPGASAHGQPWTEDETFQLLDELRRGLSTEDVAAAHRRSVRAINGRAATVLTHLTGSKHALNDSSADQLRTRLTQTASATSTRSTPNPPMPNTATSSAGQSEQDALNVLRDVLGATTVDA